MMAPGMLYGAGAGAGASNFDGVLFQKHITTSSTTKEHLGSLFVPGPSSSSFLGSSSMVSFGGANGGKKSRSFFDSFNQEDDEADELGEYFHQAEKKRRLTDNQVQFLEKSFEEENKLEPERKVKLAKELGLQPRQIAIWFQNRRARWKTKQLEKDYDALRKRYDTLKSDYNNLLKEKENLRAEVLQLNDKLLLKEEENGQLAVSDIPKHSDALPKATMADPISRIEISQVSAGVLNQQQEDLSSSKSDVFDSESPRYTDGVHSTLIDQGDSAYVFEPEQSSDISQDDDENFSKSMLSTASLLAKAEDGYRVTSSNLSYYGFPVEEDHGIGFWSY